METKNYYIIKLRSRTLIRIFIAGRHSRIGGITYVEVTRTASLLLKFLKKMNVFSFPILKVKPRLTPTGPVLYLSEVRNEKGEVILFDFLHRVLKIRMQIVNQLYESFKDFGFFKGKNPRSMVISCLGLKIAEDITPAVCLALYARWKENKGDSIGKTKNTLVVPGSNWNDRLARDIKDLVDEVIVEGKMGQTRRQLSRVITHTAKAVLQIGYLSIFKFLRKKSLRKAKKACDEMSKNKGKIMVTFLMGVQKERRNDLSFFFSSNLNPGQLLLFFPSNQRPLTETEAEWIQRNNISCVSAVGKNKSNIDIPVWSSSILFKEYLLQFYPMYLKTVIKCLGSRKKDSLWMLEKYREIEKANIFWKDFFLNNGVKILANSVPSPDNFIPSMAISEIGGIAVEFERSIRYDYCTYIHNAPNHVYFATGPYSLSQTPEPAFSLFTVQTGGLNLIETSEPIKEIEELREKSGILITVFDELPNDVFFGDSVRQMYQALINLVKADHRFSLLLKTKKPEVLGRMKDIEKEIIELSRQGKCRVLDWRISPSTAVINGHLVVSVISTAAFEGVLMGARMIIYNPMRAGSSLFGSSNGLGRRVFEDTPAMIAAIQKYADGQDDSIGDCSDIAAKLDPFGDSKGAERMGQYLEWCLDGLDSGQEWKQVITRANNRYTEKWGTDKITGKNSYEDQSRNLKNHRLAASI
jgi:hypothetical protein